MRNYIEDIRDEFRRLKDEGKTVGNTIEIVNAQFVANEPTIFGKRNEDYIEAELEWYKSKSLNVNDLFEIYGKEVAIWKAVANPDGFINSNYGWCVYSIGNGQQYRNVRVELSKNPDSRRAVMYYTRPWMHSHATQDGMNDHICTTHCVYRIIGGYLEASVYMRSNDAVFGFINDLAWQRYVHFELAKDLGVKIGPITWNAASLHIYDRHWSLIE